MLTKAELIIARQTTCNCGCKGSDPHHRRYYKRIVHLISETSGTVRLPMSSQPVAVKREILIHGDRPVYGGWTVVRDSIVYDKY